MPTVLVTGASRGLGLEFVQQYAADGWDVIACCRQPEKADKLKTLMGKHKNIRAEMLDIAENASINNLAKTLQDAPIDVLINNAGIFSGDAKPRSADQGDKGQDFGSIDVDAWEKVLHVNTIAPIMMAQTFASNVAHGKERKIVNITSKMGSIADGGPGYIAYRTSKAALNAAMATIAHDLKEQKIIIVNLHPGWVKTDMGSSAAPLEPETSIKGMKNIIAGLSLKDTGRFITYDGKTIAW